MTTTPDSPTPGPQGPSAGPTGVTGHGGPQTFTAPPPPPGTAPHGAPAYGPPPAPGTPGPTFWDQILRLGIRRDRSNGWFGGVCAGIANRLGVDPLLIRALAIILAIAGGFGFVAYVLFWLLLPDSDGKILLREVGRGDVTGIVLVVVLAILLLSGLSFGDGTWLGGWFVPIAALGIIAWIFTRKRDGQQSVAPAPGTYGSPTAAAPAYGSPSPSGPAPMAYAAPTAYPMQPTYPGTPVGTDGSVPPVPPVPPTPQSYGPPRPQRRRAPKGSGAIVLGLAVLGYGLGYLLDGPTQFNGSGHFLGLLIALGITSIGALVLGLSGRRGGLASVLTVLLLVPVGVSAVIEKAPLGPGEGQVVTWAPTGDGGYNIGTGEATLDLSGLVGTATLPSTPPAEAPAPDTVPPAESRSIVVNASVGAGRLTVLVPQDVELIVDSSVGLGSLDYGPFAEGNNRVDGIAANESTVITTGSSPTKTPIGLHLSVGLGDLIFKEK